MSSLSLSLSIHWTHNPKSKLSAQKPTSNRKQTDEMGIYREEKSMVFARLLLLLAADAHTFFMFSQTGHYRIPFLAFSFLRIVHMELVRFISPIDRSRVSVFVFRSGWIFRWTFLSFLFDFLFKLFRQKNAPYTLSVVGGTTKQKLLFDNCWRLLFFCFVRKPMKFHQIKLNQTNYKRSRREKINK